MDMNRLTLTSPMTMRTRRNSSIVDNNEDSMYIQHASEEDIDDEEDGGEGEDDEYEEGEEEEVPSYGNIGGPKFDNKRPGPRRKSCPWCSNRKCTHCRCESFARCDHSTTEPCKRVRYGRRLVCNTCERNKLKCGEHPTTKKAHTPRRHNKGMSSKRSPSIRVPTSTPLFHNNTTSDPFRLNLALSSSSSATGSSSNPPLGVAISAAAQQNALVAAMNLMHQRTSLPPLSMMAVEATSEEQECFDSVLQNFMAGSSSTTPTSMSAFQMPLSPMGVPMSFASFFTPTSASNNMMVVHSPYTPSTPITPTGVDPASFLDLMSTMDYYNVDTHGSTPGLSYATLMNDYQQPQCEPSSMNSPHQSGANMKDAESQVALQDSAKGESGDTGRGDGASDPHEDIMCSNDSNATIV